MPKLTSKKLKVKKLIKRGVNASGERQYKTTYKSIKKYFKVINEGMFGGKLSPFNEVEIKNLARQKCVGQVNILEWKRKGTRRYHLEMLPKYPSFQYFLDTLCHEMVHLYQMQNLGATGNHNKLFWSFEKKAKTLGLGL